jgi:REP element-mobilizing transposase RayT
MAPARAVEQNRDREGAATTYLITWVCYGAWLPGESGAVPRTLNRFGAPFPEPDASREQQSKDRMAQQPYCLDAVRREIVLNSLQEVCSCRDWTLLAAHIRTNHVHAVITANCNPESVMTALKAYSSQIAAAGRAMAAHAVCGQQTQCRRRSNTSFVNRANPWWCSKCAPLANAQGSAGLNLW